MDVNKFKENASKIKINAGKLTNQALEKANKGKEVALKKVNQGKDKMIKVMDKNGDGTIDIEDIIIAGLRTPGIKISREKFLRKEFATKFEEDVIENAIAKNPSSAGIEVEKIDKIADEVIKYERNCVSGISAALGAPGGVAMAVTIPTDITQYYGYMLRTTQKLMYLYGFPEINVEEKNQTFDSETMNILIICFGVMLGVSGAGKAIRAMAKGLSEGVSKKIMRTALTKGTIYPIAKKTAQLFNVTLTKKMLAGAIQNAAPVVGGVISGGITFATFKPCCDKLKKTLQDTILSNPNHIETEDENIIIDSNDELLENTNGVLIDDCDKEMKESLEELEKRKS